MTQHDWDTDECRVRVREVGGYVEVTLHGTGRGVLRVLTVRSVEQVRGDLLRFVARLEGHGP